MCQASRGESDYLVASSNYDRARELEQLGREDFNNGVGSNGWDKLVYKVDREAPDGEFNTPAYWLRHEFDGPLIRAWIRGWEQEHTLAMIRES